jgi:hypothetical protein
MFLTIPGSSMGEVVNQLGFAFFILIIYFLSSNLLVGEGKNARH